MRAHNTIPTALLIATAASACVESRTPPNIPAQATIAYGPKVYLVDNTVNAALRDEMCTRLGVPLTDSSTVATATVTPTDGVKNEDGTLRAINARSPHNCFVNVQEKQLRIDTVEVTNELFQVCVDSGVCAKPDPSAASKAQVCTTEDGFDRCPVVEVTHGQATRFCKFIGRRLPSGIEHVIARQAGATNNQDPTTIPIFPNGGREESVRPASCQAAVLGGDVGCSRPQPISIGAQDTTGAAQFDVVNGVTGKAYDLMGNVQEWTSDLLPSIRGLADNLPWFCLAPLPPAGMGQPPTCPSGAGTRCVYAQYQPSGFGLDIYPVCIAFPDLRAISGAHGSLFGGAFSDNRFTRQYIGVFARRTEASPDENPAKSYGFRCAGDVGVDDEVEPQ